MVHPSRGLLFRHAHYLDPDHTGEPLSCKVTRVAQGVVYYRAFYGYRRDGSEWLGAPSYITVADFPRIVSMLGARNNMVGGAETR